MTTQRAKYNSISIEAAMKLDGRGQLWTEKKDGVWEVREIAGCIFVGELMNNGDFFAFDCLHTFNADISSAPFRIRWAALHALLPHFAVPSGIGPEFLEAVLARGGEGIVIADLDAPYGQGLTKVKRLETLDLICAEKNSTGKSSIRLMDAAGDDFGWCPCRAQFDNIRIGDWVEVAAFGRHAYGKLREPRFIRVRHDKLTQID